MQWMKANMINTRVPPERLEEIRDLAWEEVNPESFKNAKRKMVWGLEGDENPVRPGQADG